MRHVRTFLGFAIIVASPISTGYLGYIIGRREMHREIVEDMKRYNEAAIPARTPDGQFYLITSNDEITGFYRNRLQNATNDID